MKFVLVVVVVCAVLWLMFGRGRITGRGAQRPGVKAADAPATIVRCDHCGLHLPQPEAVRDAGGRYYCSDAHRLAGPGPRPGPGADG